MGFWSDLFPSPATCIVCDDRLLITRIPYLCKSCFLELDFASFQLLEPEKFNRIDWKSSPAKKKVYRGCDFIISPLFYTGIARELIRKLKYEEEIRAALPLAEIMAGCWRKVRPSGYEDAIIVPVPLFKSRFQERGYNQAGILAELLNHKTRMKCAPDIMMRQHRTPPLYDLDEPRRREVLRQAFSIPEGMKEKIFDERVILVDDIITTGSTLNEAAETLKKAGADRVMALTAAMTKVRGSKKKSAG